MQLTLNVPCGDILLKGDSIIVDGPPRLLVLHGAGQSRRSVFRSLRDELSRRGLGSAAFDCAGHGDTGGSLQGSSLALRTKQAVEFIRAAKIASPLTIFGSSMGAYTAVRLTAILNVGALVLNVPAMYAAAAYEVPFGPDFSAVIRTHQSWVSSDAWELLQKFQGHILVISAENDKVIPYEVIKMIIDNATSAASLEHIILQGQSHHFDIEKREIENLLSERIILTATK